MKFSEYEHREYYGKKEIRNGFSENKHAEVNEACLRRGGRCRYVDWTFNME